jgi:hypothetical protein
MRSTFLLNLPLGYQVVDKVIWYNKENLEAVTKATDRIGLYDWMHLWISEGIRERVELTTSLSSAAALQVETEAENLPAGDKSLSNSLKRLERQKAILAENLDYARAMKELPVLRLEAEKLKINASAERRKYISSCHSFPTEV